MAVHRIRLHGPWLYRSLNDESRSGRITLPGERPPPDGPTAFERHFGRPTNIADGERVWLVVEGLVSRTQVKWNGRAMGEFSGTMRIDVTQKLMGRNVLTLICETSANPFAEVRLEIESD